MKWRTRVLNIACFMHGLTSLDDKGRPVPNVAAFQKKFKTEDARAVALQAANRALRCAGYVPMQDANGNAIDRPASDAPVKAQPPKSKAKRQMSDAQKAALAKGRAALEAKRKAA